MNKPDLTSILITTVYLLYLFYVTTVSCICRNSKMAFANRIGSTMGQTISQKAASMLNAARYMSSSKLFIGGLSYSTDDQSLKDAFSGFGDVVDSKVITDRDTGRSRGFGFVSFDSEDSASSALSAMDGQPLHGRNIRISYANDANRGGGTPRGNYPPRGGFGGRENDGF